MTGFKQRGFSYEAATGYLVLCVVGFLLPYSQFVPWLLEHGLNFSLFLVTGGPYRFIRHPIYTAACLLGWAGMMGNWSWRAGLFGALLFLGALGRMLCEEILVTEQYPDYRQYAKSTKRMVPGVFSLNAAGGQ